MMMVLKVDAFLPPRRLAFMFVYLLIFSYCESFTVLIPTTTRSSFTTVVVVASSTNDNDNADPPPPKKLVLSEEEIQNQMANLRSKYPTSEADYLAAARARSAAKTQSSEQTASDDDWKQIADEKRSTVGDIDDWENSAKEAGNADSQILIPMMTEGEDGEDDEEPKLLLF